MPGTLGIWAEPFVKLRVPKIFNLKTDPYERADVTSNTYYDWLLDHAFLLVPAQQVGRQIPGDVQGIPAAAESRQLFDRPGDGDSAVGGWREVKPTSGQACAAKAAI